MAYSELNFLTDYVAGMPQIQAENTWLITFSYKQPDLDIKIRLHLFYIIRFSYKWEFFVHTHVRGKYDVNV
jgi:hypothetical protein